MATGSPEDVAGPESEFGGSAVRQVMDIVIALRRSSTSKSVTAEYDVMGSHRRWIV